MSTLELTGLKSHNPLGFLAACGLLRVANVEMEAKLAWTLPGRSDGDLNDTDLTAHIYCRDVKGEETLGNRLVEIVAASAQRYLACLDEHGLTEAEALLDDYRRKGRAVIRKAAPADNGARSTLALLCALGSDLTTHKKASGKHKGRIVITNSHLLMTSGQQDLLKNKGREPAMKLAKRSKRGDIPESVRKNIKEALFGPWRYEDDDHPLGWDPHMQRLHALRNKAPTNDNKKRSVRAAVFLASQALPLFPCFTVNGQLATLGFRREGRDDWFYWPIWSKPISIDVLTSLFGQVHSSDLLQRGVVAVYRCLRASTGGTKGDYRVFSYPERIAL
jgi:hypothetical protein